MIFIARGGSFKGERLRGRVHSGGGDWLLVGADMVGRIDVRATLETEDGALILMTNTGVITWAKTDRRSSPRERRSAGKTPTSARLHCLRPAPRTTCWLNSTVTVSINQVGPTHVDYRVFAVR